MADTPLIIKKDGRFWQAITLVDEDGIPLSASAQDVNVVSPIPLAVQARLSGIAGDGIVRDVRVTGSGDLGVDMPRDIFGNIPVSDQFSIFDSTRVFEYLLPLFYTHYTEGIVSRIYNKNTSSEIFTVGVGGTYATQLKCRTKYQPLKAHKVAVTITSTQEAGVEKYFGYADLDNYTSAGAHTVDGTIQNGLVCKVSETNVYIQLYNNGTQTLDVDGIAKSDWNIDKLDGNGPSLITLNFEYSQIGLLELEWLGVGALLFYYNIGGVNIPIHKIENANVRAVGVYMRTANLSPFVMIKSVGGVGSIEAICSAVVSGGGHNPVGVPRVAETANAIAVANGNTEAVLFIRLKPEAYEASVDITGISAIAETSSDCIFRLHFNPAWNGSAINWIDKPNSHIQQATAAGDNNITDEGITLDYNPLSTDSDAFNALVESKLKLGKNLQTNANQEGLFDVICLSVESLNSNEIYEAAIKYKDNG